MKQKLFLLSACMIFLMTGCFGTKNEKKEVKKASDVTVKVNKTEGMDLKTYFTENNEIIFDVTNTGSDIIDYLNIDVAFFDKDGNLMKTDKQYLKNITSKKQDFVKLSLAQYDEKGTITLPTRIEISLNKTIYSTKFETVYNDKVTGEVAKTDTDSQLSLNLSNNSGETLDDVAAAVVFYKDSKPVDVQVSSFQSVGTSASQTIYVPTISSDNGVKQLDYDETKVIINNASKYVTQ